MPHERILLVDEDVDALALLAERLRKEGLHVALANGLPMACERARSVAYDAVLTTRALAEPSNGAIGIADALSVELADAPPLLILVDDEAAAEATTHRVQRADVRGIVSRVATLAKGRANDGRAARASLVPSAHAVENTALADLLVVLATELRSGTLTVTTPKGSGEVRLVEGDVADAVYVRLEGKKALTRMIGERDGTANFAPGSPAVMRRIHESTRALVAEARALAERAQELRGRASHLASTMLHVVDASGAKDALEVEQHVLNRLRIPASLDDLLDDLPHDDVSILETVLRLDGDGRLKRLGARSSRVQLCGADQLHRVRAAAARAKHEGFAGPARIVFAAIPTRVAITRQTLMSLSDTIPSTEGPPSLPVPHPVVTIRLGDGVDLEVAALPLVPAYAPLWPMAIAGAVTVVRLDEAASDALEEVCRSVGTSILDARAIFGAVDESSAVQVASLIKTALETGATTP